MATGPISTSVGPGGAAHQIAGLQGTGRPLASRASDVGTHRPQMEPIKLTLPLKSKSFQAAFEEEEKRFFQEDLLRSTIIERVASQESGHEFAEDVQSNHSTILERLSSFVSSDETVAPESFEEVHSEPHFKMLADRVADLKAKGLELNELAQNIEKAKSVSVDPAKRTFWQKFGGAAVSLGVVAFFTALTIATGGAAAIAGLSAASLLFVKNAGDTYCALKVVQNKQAELAGKEKPHGNVPMGADWIGNICFSALAKLNNVKIASGDMTTDDIKAKAKKWSFGINTALRIVSISATGVAGMASGAAWLPRLASIAFSAATLAVTISLDQYKQSNEQMVKMLADENLPARMLQLSDHYSELLTKANELPQEQKSVLFEKLATGLNALADDFMELESRLLRAQEKLAVESSSTNEAIKGGLTEGLLSPGAVQVARRGLEQLPAVQSAGMNLESSASSILLFKTAYECWRMMNDVSERSAKLASHAEVILNIRGDLDPSPSLSDA